MVRYAENSFEKIINKLVFISIFALIILLLLDIYSYFTSKSFISEVTLPIGIIINLIFFVDLVLIYRKRSSFSSFVKKNWLDIIAVLPFDLFRFAKVARLAKITRVFSRQGKLVRFLPKVFFFKGAKAFSKETDFNKQIDRTRDRILEMKLKKYDNEMNKLAGEIKKILV